MIRRACTIAALVVFGNLVGFGCAAALKDVDAVNNPADDAKLADCRELARDVKTDSGDPDAGYHAYLGCTKEAGF